MSISTASVATALYKRGLRNQFIQGVQPVSWKRRNMVGQAFTLRYIPAREDRNPITVFRNRSEEHTSELQSLMRISYAVFCLKKKKTLKQNNTIIPNHHRQSQLTQQANQCILQQSIQTITIMKQ